jgi:hypothetical protein
MASSDLTWTEAESPVNQIEEYRVFKSTNVLPSASNFADSFVLLDTLPVVRDPEPPFDEVHPLEFSDTAVDFSTNFYCYRVDAVSVLVGEATGGSPQTGVGPSNIECLGDPPEAAVLDAVEVTEFQIDLSWVDGAAGVLPIFVTEVFRSEDAQPFVLIAEVFEPTTVFSDTTVNTDDHTYSYFVVSKDEAGIESEPSNIVSFGVAVDIFVAVAVSLGTGKRVMTSDDGFTWDVRQIVDGGWSSVIWSPDVGDLGAGRIVVLAGVAINGVTVYFSDDGGASWNPALSTPGGSGWNAVAWSSDIGLFAAISANSNTNGNKVMISSDGKIWAFTTTPAGADNAAWSGMEYDATSGFFVASGSTADRIMTSPDGLVWTERSTPASGITDGLGVSSGGRLVTSNRGNNENMFSDDAINWTLVPVPNGWLQGITDMQWGAGVFAGSGNGSVGHVSSSDGENWSVNTLAVPYDTGVYEALTYSIPLGLWVVIKPSQQPDCVMTSGNGSTWTGGTIPDVTPSPPQWRDVTFARRPSDIVQQTIVMVESGTGPNNANVSLNGQDWDENDTTSTAGFRDVAWSPTLQLFAAVSPSDVVFTSPDGITWTGQTRANAAPWVTVAWASTLSLFIKGASDAGTIMIGTSSDGLTWTTRTTPDGTIVHDVVAAPTGTNVITVGRNGLTAPTGNVLHSTDGLTWAAPTGVHALSTCVACEYDTTRSRFVVCETGGQCNVSTTGASGWSLNINAADLGGGWAGDSCNMAYSPTLDVLVLVGDEGLYISQDGGVNWSQQSFSTPEDVEWSSVLNKFIACSDSGQLLISSTNGITWQNEPIPAGNSLSDWRGIAMGDEV